MSILEWKYKPYKIAKEWNYLTEVAGEDGPDPGTSKNKTFPKLSKHFFYLPAVHCSMSGSVDPDVLLQSSSENGFLE